MTPPMTYVVGGEKTSPKFAYAFAQGCRGRVVPHAQGLQDGDFAAFCTPPVWPLLRQAQADGRTWWYGDHAYFGRGEYYRVTRNAFQHDGTGQASPDRFTRFGLTVKPWRRDGRHIVVCPNSRIYCGLHGFDVDAWVHDLGTQIRTVSDREIRVRWKTDSRPLSADLVNAWAVVVYSSAAALHALVAGVPIVTLAPFAASVGMGRTSITEIESPIYPDDRVRFLSVLCHHQWTLGEMASGAAWRALQAAEESRAA